MVSIPESRNFQLAIGLAGIVIASATMAIPYNYQTTVLALVRPIELVASGLLIFGVLKQRSLHKKKIVLTWLICSLVFVVGILHDFLQYTWSFDHLTSVILACVLLVVAALKFGMMYVMYNSYVKLIDDTDERLLPA